MFEISPFLIDIILVGVVVEFLVLFAVLRNAGAAFLIWPLFLFLLSGGFLLAAARLALSASGTLFIGAALFAALVTHSFLLRWAAQRYLINRDQKK